jgi:hypothetical protein
VAAAPSEAPGDAFEDGALGDVAGEVSAMAAGAVDALDAAASAEAFEVDAVIVGVAGFKRGSGSAGAVPVASAEASASPALFSTDGVAVVSTAVEADGVCAVAPTGAISEADGAGGAGTATGSVVVSAEGAGISTAGVSAIAV